MMQETLNIQHAEKEALPYEPPCMTIVPIRATGAMLVGSMENRVSTDRTFFYESQSGEPGNSATVWNNETTSQGWSTSNSFFANGE